MHIAIFDNFFHNSLQRVNFKSPPPSLLSLTNVQKQVYCTQLTSNNTNSRIQKLFFFPFICLVGGLSAILSVCFFLTFFNFFFSICPSVCRSVCQSPVATMKLKLKNVHACFTKFYVTRKNWFVMDVSL